MGRLLARQRSLAWIVKKFSQPHKDRNVCGAIFAIAASELALAGRVPFARRDATDDIL